MKTTPPSRHNQRAAGKTHTTISLSEAVLEKARKAAAADDRSLSKWLERLIAQKVSEYPAAAPAAPAAKHHSGFHSVSESNQNQRKA